MEPLQARQFGHYRLLARLGAGGMSEIFLATSARADRQAAPVVIKRMLPALANDPDFVSMLVDEAKIAAALEHPSICRVLDLGLDGQEIYLVMEFIHGKTLRVAQRRAEQRDADLSFPLIAFVVAEMAAALDYAHQRVDAQGKPLGIVHRDVNPHNILLSYAGEVKLIDFGIARAANRIVKTKAGYVKGKIPYMAPEQAMSKPVDARTDVFALGAVLFEMLTGRRAFLGQTDREVVDKIVSGEYPDPRLLRPATPDALVEVVAQALQREPEARYARAGDMAAALAAYLATLDTEVGEAQVAGTMHRLFADDFSTEEQLLAQLLAGETAPTSETGRQSDSPNFDLVASGLLAADHDADDAGAAAERPSRATRPSDEDRRTARIATLLARTSQTVGLGPKARPAAGLPSSPEPMPAAPSVSSGLFRDTVEVPEPPLDSQSSSPQGSGPARSAVSDWRAPRHPFLSPREKRVLIMAVITSGLIMLGSYWWGLSR